MTYKFTHKIKIAEQKEKVQRAQCDQNDTHDDTIMIIDKL